MMRSALLAACAMLALCSCGAVKGTARVGKFAVRATGKVAMGATRTAVNILDRDKKPPPGNTSTDRPKTYTVRGRTYRTMTWSQTHDFEQQGEASWYGYEGGSKTASGERYRPSAMTAAHKTLPLGSMVRVRNLRNGKTVTVRINDRGPFVKGRIIDCSRAAADRLGFKSRGVTDVHIEVVGR